jgi:hypothetical protein
LQTIVTKEIVTLIGIIWVCLESPNDKVNIPFGRRLDGLCSLQKIYVHRFADLFMHFNSVLNIFI